MASFNLLNGLMGNKSGGSSTGTTSNVKPQSNVQLFQSSATSLSSVPQTIIQNQIRNPNGYAMSGLFIDLNVTDTTGSSSAPSGVNSIETAFTSLVITGATGKQLLKCNPNSGDQLRKLQHRFNQNGYYNTPPTPADSAVSTAYSVDYLVMLHNWVIAAKEFPLTVEWQLNTLSSRATTLNSMTSTAQITMYADFVPLKSSLPPTVIKIKPVTGIAASTFNFQTYLDTTPIIDLSLDVGSADTVISSTNSFNILVNNVPLVANSAYQNVINAEDRLYPITTPHITGYFPLNVLSGMTTLNPAVEQDSVEVDFTSAPDASGTSGRATLYMIEPYVPA